MRTDFDHVRELADRHDGILTRRAARANGISDATLRRLTRGGVLARVTRGVYAVGRIEVTHPRVIARRHRVVISDESAAALLGADLPRPTTTVSVIAPRNRGQRVAAYRGARLRRCNLTEDDIVVVSGLRVTSPLRTALDVARHATLEDAVCVVDALMRAGRLTAEQFTAAALRAGGPGRRRLRLVAELVDDGSGSIFESRTRVLLWHHGLRPPASQVTLTHRSSGWRGRVDFAWPALRLALECDGFEWHGDRNAFHADRRRWNALTQLGWQLVVITWHDVVNDPLYVVATIRLLLQQHTMPVTAAAQPSSVAPILAPVA